MLNFVAFDFETANYQRESVCELGIAVVEDGQISETRSWRIRPTPNWFHPGNIRVHGITAQDVAHAPNFAAIWHEAKPYFEHSNVVAHNASFDMSCLRHVLSQYELAFPRLSYACSLQVARQAWSGFRSYGLGPLSQRFSIDLHHHAAESDAVACAQILVRACQEHIVSDFSEIGSAFGLRMGKLYYGGYEAAGKLKRNKRYEM
ncbi:3'-5' exonuclease [Tunicatimonas pelagia]|uniref:3'-5' exonuclease n=1 Tax=Tunicatimonas pelagia TaxID=931531 RepID=UPI002666229C|nr:3'-5' exonuclease [Tunicatimonas pelagia]WKN42311.1 3'-5' exonuclease [Tunicatimonas pelagia]